MNINQQINEEPELIPISESPHTYVRIRKNKLNAYRDEIIELRNQGYTIAELAEELSKRHGINVANSQLGYYLQNLEDEVDIGQKSIALAEDLHEQIKQTKKISPKVLKLLTKLESDDDVVEEVKTKLPDMLSKFMIYASYGIVKYGPQAANYSAMDYLTCIKALDTMARLKLTLESDDPLLDNALNVMIKITD